MSGQGFNSKLAVAVQSTFGTAATVTDLVPFTSESIIKNIQQVESELLDGIYGKKQIYQSFESGSGEVGGEAVIDEIAGDPIGWEHFILAALGAGSYVTGPPAFNHYYTAASLPMLTLALLKYHGSTAKVWELRSAKVNTLEISGAVGTSGGKVSWNAALLAEKLLRTGESGIVNTTATFSGITPTNKPEPLLMSRLTLKIADITDALTSGDEISIEEFTLSINNNLSEDTFASVDSSHSDASLPIEHERNDRMEVTLRLVRPRLKDLTFYDWFRQNTTLQAELQFDSIDGNNYFKIYLPYLKITEDPSAGVDGAALLKEEINLTAVYNTSNLNNVMTVNGSAITGPIAMVANSKRTAVPS